MLSTVLAVLASGALLAAVGAVAASVLRARFAPSALLDGAAPDGAAPAQPAAPTQRDGTAPSGRDGRPLFGAILQDAGVLTDAELLRALGTQARTGGRLGEILVASGAVTSFERTAALAVQLEMEMLHPADVPGTQLDPDEARACRAVGLARRPDDEPGLLVAVADPTPGTVARLEASLGSPVRAKLCDDAVLDELHRRVYADRDADEVTGVFSRQVPELSAYKTGLALPQGVIVAWLVALVAGGLLLAPRITSLVLVALAIAFFVVSVSFRVYVARQGLRRSATFDPPPADIAALDERSLPVYTILLPLYKEKRSTVRELLASLDRLDYPKHKLEALLLTEDDDDATREAIAAVGRPAWMRVLRLPPGVPRTKPRAMGIGLRHARGTYVTVYDAEDRPDPAQLKKAVLGFRSADASLACLQAKLSYYNPRQNLLTRWFTLEYDAWFNAFLPGLHRLGAPIPLGGTSNHFRREALDHCLGWDPYNVTEDADLGLRLARLGLRTAMLESTTEEEANSRLGNWLRQRSRWSKGYMQTLLVHTRRPGALVAQIGLRATVAFLLTIGGAILTLLLAPLFWVLLILWIYTQPEWIAQLFPGPIFYPASLCLLLGNFLLVQLSLAVAVAREHDDLAPYALLTPVYWLLMSAATYVALVELFARPYHWHKTEHGLHLAEEHA